MKSLYCDLNEALILLKGTRVRSGQTGGSESMLVRCGGNLPGVQIDLVVDLVIVVVVDDDHLLEFLKQKREVVGSVDVAVGKQTGVEARRDVARYAD